MGKKKLPRLTSYLRTFGNVSYKYKYDDLQSDSNVVNETKNGVSPSMTWSEVCSSVGNSDICRQLRQLVADIVGTEESVAGVLDDACLHFLQTFIDEQRLSLSVYKQLELKYGNLPQSSAEKIFRASKEI